MPNELLQYDITHIAGLIIAIFGLIISGILIRKFTKKYENTEILWIPWWLVISLVVGNKFI